MEIILGELRGFCNGVKHAISTANEVVENEKVYCLGQIVHNERVIQDLEAKGMITINSIEEAEDHSKVIIRAHGERKEVYDRAKEKNIELIDLTCGKVKAVRNNVSEKKEDSFVLLIGKKNHPETKGVISFAGENSYILENEEDIEELKELFKKTNLKKIYVVAHTTFNSEKFDRLANLVKENIDAEIEVNKTVCNATSNRQKEAAELSKNVDIMIIVGGKNSSNTKELEIVSKENCNEVYFIQEAKDLEKITIAKNKKIGITAGASTPEVVINEVIEYLKSL